MNKKSGNLKNKQKDELLSITTEKELTENEYKELISDISNVVLDIINTISTNNVKSTDKKPEDFDFSGDLSIFKELFTASFLFEEDELLIKMISLSLINRTQDMLSKHPEPNKPEKLTNLVNSFIKEQEELIEKYMDKYPIELSLLSIIYILKRFLDNSMLNDIYNEVKKRIKKSTHIEGYL